MRILALIAALTTAACFGAGQLPNWKVGQLTPEEQSHAKTVEGVVEYLTFDAWSNSRWYRMGDHDEDFPVYLIIASDRTACIGTAVDATLAQRGDHYPCRGPWRIAR